MAETLVEVRGLKKYFPVTKGIILKKTIAQVKAVDDISFHVNKNEAFGLAGESGSGKTTTARVIAGLYPPSGGEIFFDNVNVTAGDPEKMLEVRKRVGMVFQDPYSSLNPRKTVTQIVGAPLETHGYPKEKIRDRVLELVEQVGLTPEHASRYPHMFSGGQRQRIAIARALALQPELIIADEAVSALDVSIQSSIINMVMDLREKFGMALLFIAHDLNAMRHICDRIGVMYLGKIVEIARSKDIFSKPLHPYTKALIGSTPVPDPDYMAARKRIILEGMIPSPLNIPLGCRFNPRCPLAKSKGMPAECTTQIPELREVEKDHWVACHFA